MGNGPLAQVHPRLPRFPQHCVALVTAVSRAVLLLRCIDEKSYGTLI